MVAEPNWWSGQSGPTKNNITQNQSEPEKEPEAVDVKAAKPAEDSESKTFLSADKSGHYVPDAYQRMLQRMKTENPAIEPQKEEVMSRVAAEETTQNTQKEQPDEPETKIGGGSKYLAKLKTALQSVIEGDSSLNLVMPIKNLSAVEFKKAGKNKDGEVIYEVCEDNVTLGYADHTIYS